ncbi:MAG: hypothetical protein LBL82_05035 [Oscillospiraceae bacterium]|jgi:hypothetical protein|nr:hypothetical protein [Oscillospiraceae bacterium]
MAASIATSLDDSYKKLMLLNGYNYINFGNSIWWQTLEIRYFKSLYEILLSFSEVRRIEGVDSNNLIPTIKKYIDDNRLIVVAVDSFSLIEESLHYNNTHQIHSWIFSGYDDEKDELYCFADSDRGYGENKVSIENFKRSVVLQTYTDLLELVISDKRQPFVFNLETVCANARSICADIAKISYCNFWKCDKSDYTEDRCYDLTKFVDRQKANIMLMDMLYEQGEIGKHLCEDVKVMCEDTQRGWNLLRMKFLKSWMNRKVPNYEDAQRSAWRCMRKEYDYWRYFIKNSSEI